MKYKFLKTLFAIAFFLLLITGCKKEEVNETLPGVWQYYSANEINEHIFYEFNEDSTGTFNFNNEVVNFKYEYDENEIKITYENEKTSNYKYKIDKDILVIKDSFDDDISYKKLKTEDK